MDYKNTYFEIDPMVVFKQTALDQIKVIRLDEDFSLNFEDHLSVAWKLISENKSLEEIIVYFTNTCGLTRSDANSALTEFVSTLEEQNLGKTQIK